MSTQFPTDVVQQVNAVLEAWKKIDPNGQFGDLTQAKMAADLAQSDPLLTEMGALDAELTRVRNKRDALYATLWDEVKRVRNSVKGVYGDDSTEYEMVGGTRKSDRKPVSRKITPTTPAQG
jgi:50S ribosomal subunit-associated GTPase HflX